jgi:hypothetical protein
MIGDTDTAHDFVSEKLLILLGFEILKRIQVRTIGSNFFTPADKMIYEPSLLPRTNALVHR